MLPKTIKSRAEKFVQSSVRCERIFARLFLSAMLCLSAVACRTASPLENLPAQTLILATARDSGTFDPALIVPLEWTPLAQIYETLVEWDYEGGRLAPKLAVEWRRADELTWIFHLRENARFHDGTFFDANAAKFSLERFIKLRGNWQGLNVTAINAPAPHVLEIKTREPFAFLPEYLAYLNLAMVSPAAVEKYAVKFAENPVGTGAFRLAAYRPQQDAVLTRYADYWGTKPKLETIVYRYLPDAQTQILALEAGEIDACRAVPLPEVARFRHSQDFSVQTGAGRHTHHLVFNRKASAFREEFDDARFRRAFNFAVNRRELVRLTLNGIGQPADSAVPPWFNLPTQNPTNDYDVEQAKNLLAELNWIDADGDGVLEKDGRPLELRFVFSPNWYPQNSAMAEVLQMQLARIGVRLVLQPLEWGAAERAERAGAADIRHRGITFAVGGVQYGLWSAYHSSNGAFKSVHYGSAAVDRLLIRAKSAATSEAAAIDLAEVVEILRSDAPDVPLYYDEEVIIQNKRVAGGLLKTHPAIYPLNLNEIYIKNE